MSDATRRDFPPCTFDAVYSRDALLHVNDKAALFARAFAWLKPGGRLLVTDYARWACCCCCVLLSAAAVC